MSSHQDTNNILLNIMTNYVNRFLHNDEYDWLVYCKFVNMIIELYKAINNSEKTNKLIVNTIKFLEQKIKLTTNNNIAYDCINFVLKLNNVLVKIDDSDDVKV